MTTTGTQAHAKLTDDGLEQVNDQHEIPGFRNEAEEAAYWATHTLGEPMLEQMRPAREVDSQLPPPRVASSAISVRFDADVLHRLRKLAAARGVPYQTLLKRFVIERLYEEEQRSEPNLQSTVTRARRYDEVFGEE
jgi:hypothetical protein